MFFTSVKTEPHHMNRIKTCDAKSQLKNTHFIKQTI